MVRMPLCFLLVLLSVGCCYQRITVSSKASTAMPSPVCIEISIDLVKDKDEPAAILKIRGVQP